MEYLRPEFLVAAVILFAVLNWAVHDWRRGRRPPPETARPPPEPQREPDELDRAVRYIATGEKGEADKP